jgi:predicted helicase
VSSMKVEDLLEKLWFSATNSTEKGSSFERLIASYLRTAPEFADRFEEVYLWQEWPDRGNAHDHGIDIVAKDVVTGGWCAVQCKFYDPQHHVSKKDVDSFLGASSKKGFTSRIIVSTAKDWGPTVENQLDNLVVPVVRIGVSDLMESKVDWGEIDWTQPQTVLPTTGKKTALPHQRQARKAVREGLMTHDRGQMIMACGTGKTFTSLKIAEELATGRKSEPTTVLFLVPSIQLLNQTLREWKQESQIPFRAYAVCSDVQVGKTNASEDLSVRDLIYPATTDTEILAREITKRTEDDQFTVVFSTYQSIDVVARAQGEGMPTFDLIICDEAHRTTGVTLADADESHFVRVHDNTYLAGTKRLYMTATPRLFDPNTKEKAQANEAVLASMDDEKMYGPVLHRLGFGEAVERDLLTDYKVLVLKVDEDFVAANFQQELGASGEIKLGDAAKLIGCWNGLAKRFGTQLPEGMEGLDLTPMRRAVAFAKDIKASKAAVVAFPGIVDRLRTTVEAASDAESSESDTQAAGFGIEIKHVDGTMNALERGNLLQWLKDGPAKDDDVCRVLTNARCLSEGVDVPGLDAVMFLTPRGSQVDIVQSVGRVMRKDPTGVKQMGYIILPIVVPSGLAPEEALRDNERFRVVWQVLQALRAHDDRFNAMVNKIDLNKKDPDKIVIIDAGGAGGEGKTTDPAQLALPFGIEQWRDSIYAKIVQKVGERRYWETWAKDVAEIAQQHIVRITGLLAESSSPAAKEFESFLEGLQGNLNEGISQDDAIEMLAQHLITRPVFDALFGGYDFAAANPVAHAMEKMLALLDEHSLDTENSSLEKFYDSVRSKVEGVDNAEGRQKIIIELYDKFFATAFKKTVDKLGIVYTPVEIVDFILNSADQVLREHFGHGLTDEGVHILDGFTGTGTFMVRLLQSGLIKPEDLARKYANELHANEILLLAYYIAAVNIETTYQDLMSGSLQEQAAYEPFPGLILTDTFQSWEDDDVPDLAVFPENNERLERLKGLDITVIVGNPPYSSGQDSANDDNANEKYTQLDTAIRDSYAARSNATNKNSLYDSYIRAIKWATLRIKDRGVIAFVTNGGFLDSNTADGMRQTLAEEFSAIHVYNLRGNQRTAGEQSRREGGKVFGAGSRATVAITILVKDPGQPGLTTIHYTDVGDYLTREEKLRKVSEACGVTGLQPVTQITPNDQGDWLDQRRDDFGTFLAIAAKSGETIFTVSAYPLLSARDAWVYGSSKSCVAQNASRIIATFNSSVDSGERVMDKTLISWSESLEGRWKKKEQLSFDSKHLRSATYRPFFKQRLYFDAALNHRRGLVPQLFPTTQTANVGVFYTTPGSSAPFLALMTDGIPDVVLAGAGNAGQVVTRWRYEEVESSGMLDLPTDGEQILDGYRRIDNVRDEALGHFRATYGDSITKDDIFFYVYAMLHSSDYNEIYQADLKKMLPRIPLVEKATPFIEAGRGLSKLHLGYETATAYPIEGLDVDAPTGDAAYDFFRVTKMRFGKVTAEQKASGERADRTTIVYNDRITLNGIPDAAYRYMLGSRSAIEWIIDRYQVKTDKPSGIVNDPNDWSREVKDPRYILDLLARIVTVSLETMQIVDNLPPLAIRADQNPVGAK